FYDYENWGVINALKHKIESGELQLYCVDSIDKESFYNRSAFPSVRIARHLQYESYLINEVLPLIRRKNQGSLITTAGCSMGAYHAINLGMKYPWLFSKAVGISGRYDLTLSPGPFKDLLNGFHDELVYLNMPQQYIPNLNDQFLLKAIAEMEIIIAVGEEDPFLSGNKTFSSALKEKGISHQFYVWGDHAHCPHFWRKMVPMYI
ncbi:MAG: esterase, partial [Chryseobacterium sp.]